MTRRSIPHTDADGHHNLLVRVHHDRRPRRRVYPIDPWWRCLVWKTNRTREGPSAAAARTWQRRCALRQRLVMPTVPADRVVRQKGRYSRPAPSPTLRRKDPTACGSSYVLLKLTDAGERLLHAKLGDVSPPQRARVVPPRFARGVVEARVSWCRVEGLGRRVQLKPAASVGERCNLKREACG